MAGVFPGIILTLLFIGAIYLVVARKPEAGPPGQVDEQNCLVFAIAEAALKRQFRWPRSNPAEAVFEPEIANLARNELMDSGEPVLLASCVGKDGV